MSLRGGGGGGGGRGARGTPDAPYSAQTVSAPRAGAGGSPGSPEPHATGCGERCRWQQQPAPVLGPQLNLLQTPSITSSVFYPPPPHPVTGFGLISFVCMVWVQHLDAQGAAWRWEDGAERGCSHQRLVPARAESLPLPPRGIGVVGSCALNYPAGSRRKPFPQPCRGTGGL